MIEVAEDEGRVPSAARAANAVLYASIIICFDAANFLIIENGLRPRMLIM